MIPKQDLALYRQQSTQVATLAKQKHREFFYTLDLTKPEAARDALLLFTPDLVASFAPVAGLLAQNFYQSVRLAQTGQQYRNFVMADVAPKEQVQKMVRYSAGHLFTDDPGQALAGMDGSVQRYVMNMGRQSIADNAFRDPLKPRYARVPSGKCCAFCSMLSSRGFVYGSKANAGDIGAEFNRYHDHDECAVVADWSHDPRVDGFDPASRYRAYLSARAASGSPNIHDIAAEMRRQEPHLYTDGVATAD